MSGRINGHITVDEFIAKFPGESKYDGETDIEIVARIASRTRVAMERLYKIIDNIDTLNDVCKDNDAEFREQCNLLLRARWNIIKVKNDNSLEVIS